MAALYVDESFPLPVVETVRRLGHDVLTAILTLNRWDFVGLHAGVTRHAGIVSSRPDPRAARFVAGREPHAPALR